MKSVQTTCFFGSEYIVVCKKTYENSVNKEQKYGYRISPPVVFCKKGKICSQNFRKIHRKTAVMKSDKVAGLQAHVTCAKF